MYIELEVEVGTNEEIQSLGRIYYSCKIGDAGSKNDVKNGQMLTNEVQIHAVGEEETLGYSTTIGNYDTMTIVVSRQGASNLSQWHDQPVVDTNETMGFTLSAANDGGTDRYVVVVDNLPYDNDGHGSRFTGDLIVKEIQLLDYDDENSKEWLSNLRFFATINSEYQNTDSATLQSEAYGLTSADAFDASGDWDELYITDNGILDLSNVDGPMKAFVAVGTVPAGQTLQMHLVISLPDSEPGDIVYNWLSYNTLECCSQCRVVSRVLRGRTWLDANNNGLYDEKETLLSGVTVTLYEKTTVDKTISYREVASTTTGSDGSYAFVDLEAGTYEVRFTSQTGDEFELKNYKAAKVDQGTDDTIDSDGVPNYNANDVLLRTVITDIEMPVTSLITSSDSKYYSSNNDSGFVPLFDGTLVIVKRDTEEKFYLTGAEFTLDELNCTDGHVEYTQHTDKCWKLAEVYTNTLVCEETHVHVDACYQAYTGEEVLATGSSGTLTVRGLTAGTYRLVETKAPDGYLLNSTEIYFNVNDWEDFELINGNDVSGFVALASEDYGATLKLTVKNRAGVELPKSGGEGTYLYTLGGTLMILAALLWYSNTSRRKEENASS